MIARTHCCMMAGERFCSRLADAESLAGQDRPVVTRVDGNVGVKKSAPSVVWQVQAATHSTIKTMVARRMQRSKNLSLRRMSWGRNIKTKQKALPVNEGSHNDSLRCDNPVPHASAPAHRIPKKAHSSALAVEDRLDHSCSSVEESRARAWGWIRTTDRKSVV